VYPVHTNNACFNERRLPLTLGHLPGPVVCLSHLSFIYLVVSRGPGRIADGRSTLGRFLFFKAPMRADAPLGHFVTFEAPARGRALDTWPGLLTVRPSVCLSGYPGMQPMMPMYGFPAPGMYPLSGMPLPGVPSAGAYAGMPFQQQPHHVLQPLSPHQVAVLWVRPLQGHRSAGLSTAGRPRQLA
jgi:hypothetical protein